MPRLTDENARVYQSKRKGNTSQLLATRLSSRLLETLTIEAQNSCMVHINRTYDSHAICRHSNEVACKDTTLRVSDFLRIAERRAENADCTEVHIIPLQYDPNG